jgi:hypothetical protein
MFICNENFELVVHPVYFFLPVRQEHFQRFIHNSIPPSLEIYETLDIHILRARVACEVRGTSREEHNQNNEEDEG